MANSSKNLPAIFFGHGSPMNAIENNSYTETWRKLVKNISPPKAILVISAHYETAGTKITANEIQKTIHDFYGFTAELFNVKYQPKGDLELAKRIQKLIPESKLDDSWGLDHGAWSVLIHTHRKADIPTIQLSLDKNKTAKEHYELAKKLKILRGEGVLIIGSGNIVHNLGLLNWKGGKPYSWAEKFNRLIIKAILENYHQTIINFYGLEGAKESVPSAEHFLPLLYILALREEGEKVEIFNDEIELGSIGMTSVVVG